MTGRRSRRPEGTGIKGVDALIDTETLNGEISGMPHPILGPGGVPVPVPVPTAAQAAPTPVPVATTGQVAPVSPAINAPWYKTSGNVLSVVFFVIGTVLTLYLYEKGKREPELMYSMSPTRSELNRPTLDPAFSFTYQGKSLDADSVSISEVGIWNAGKESIRHMNILEPIKLKLSKPSRIVSVKIKSTSRQSCNVHLTGESGWVDGEFGVDWDILQHDEGAVFQVIYLGGTDLWFNASGTIENQAAVERYVDRRVQSPYANFANGLDVFLLLIVVVIMIINIRIGPKAYNSDPSLRWSKLARVVGLRTKSKLDVIISNVVLLAVVVAAIITTHNIIGNHSSQIPFSW